MHSQHPSREFGRVAASRNQSLADSDDEYDSIADEELLSAEQVSVNRRADTKRPSPFTSTEDGSPKKAKLSLDAACTHLAQKILQKTWGFQSFRLKQEPVITRLISGGSAVVIFPTGGGKSLVYQIPAIAFDEHDKHRGQPSGGGITLVVSPLIALMKVWHILKVKIPC